MKRRSKTAVFRRINDILQSDKGTSIVLVTIIAILIVSGVVILRITTSSLWASADKQYNQDKAYVMASSIGDSIDALIRDNKLNLDSYQNANRSLIFEDKASSAVVKAYVSNSGDGYLIEAEATVADSVYVYRAYYYKANPSSPYKRELI